VPHGWGVALAGVAPPAVPAGGVDCVVVEGVVEAAGGALVVAGGAWLALVVVPVVVPVL